MPIIFKPAATVIPVLNAINGLRNVGYTVLLGGNLVTFTQINGKGNFFSIVSNDPTVPNSNLQIVGNSISGGATDPVNTNGSTFVFDPTQAYITHQNTSGSIASLLMTDLSMLITDGINSKGLENAGDYEANFTARSLVTKQYVLANALVTAESGVYKPIPGVVRLGGALLVNTVIDPNSKQFAIAGLDTSGRSVTFGLLGNGWQIDANDTVTADHSTVKVDSLVFNAKYTKNSANIDNEINLDINGSYINAIKGAVQKKINLDVTTAATGIQVTDTLDSKGFVNQGDYEANFVSRSLITQQYLTANSPFKANSLSLASQTVTTSFVYTNPLAGGKFMFQLNSSLEIRAMAGATVTIVIAFTDRSNTLRTVTIFNQAVVVGTNYSNIYNIQSTPGTTITVTNTITVGTATYDVAQIISSMGI